MTAEKIELARQAVRRYLERVRVDLETDVFHYGQVIQYRFAMMRGIVNEQRPKLPEGATAEQVMNLYGQYPDRMEYDDELAEAIIRKSKMDPAAHEALVDIAQELIEKGNALPPRLGQFVVSAMREPPPARRTGPRLTRTRNVHLVVAIKLACDAAGISATRGTTRPGAKSRICGADIVGQVWKELGHRPISATTLQDIWSAHAHMRSQN